VRRVRAHGPGEIDRPPRGRVPPAEGCLPTTSPEELWRAREYAVEQGLGIVADGGVVEEEALGQWIPQALKAVRPLAEANHVAIAVENHQDIASDELRWLCEEVGGDCIGVPLDTGSTLAVAESPLAFARRVKPFVRNVHLKDYTAHLSPTGYRLSTCAIGDGVIDFPALFDLFADRPDLLMSIELGARQARHVELLEEDWWTDYPPRDLPVPLAAHRVVFLAARPADGDYRIPHERGESPEALRTYELDEFEHSVAYLKHITAHPAEKIGNPDR